MTRLLAAIFIFCLTVFAAVGGPNVQADKVADELQQPGEAPAGNGINHIVWIWFENRENTQITGATAPFFTSFAAANVNFTNFYGVSHPSQPNYIDAFSGSNQGVTNDNHFTFPASADNLAKQLATAGKSWRVYAQAYPGSCSDIDTGSTVTDGVGAAGYYARKHNPAISFESVRLDPVQCANIQPLANFDPTVNFAFVVPNMINDMHDGTTGQGNTFLQAFTPLVTNSPDWAHTLYIVTFDEGVTNTNGGGHIYTAAAAPWLTAANVTTTYNHFNVLRTIEQTFGLPFLGSAATATTITELLPPAVTPTPTNTPTNTPTATPTMTPSAATISGTVTYPNASAPPKYVSNVLVSGAGSPAVSTLTDGLGGYSLSGFGAGSYTITPTKTDGVNGISSFDAARIAQYVAGVGFPVFTDRQLIAADTSNNGSVSSFDAGLVARFAVAVPPYGITGTWKFLPASRNYPSVSSNIVGEDYEAILVGEVSGNWNPAARPAIECPLKRSSAVSLPNLITPADDDIVIPVGVTDAAGKGIISYEFDLRYDPSVIQPKARPVELVGTISSKFSVVANAEEPGLVRLAVYGPMPLTGSGVLLNLRFAAVGTPGSVSPLVWEKMMFNEGDPQTTATDGQVELSEPGQNHLQ